MKGSIYKSIVIFFLVFLFAGSCKKKVVAHTRVIQYENISLPEKTDVRFFSFPSLQTGYAVGGTTALYKTTDGGKNWLSLNKTGISYVDFVNETIGYCISEGEGLLKTTDGGQSWSIKTSGDYLGICKTGSLIVASKEQNNKLLFRASADQAESFYYCTTLNSQGITSLRVTSNSAFGFGTPKDITKLRGWAFLENTPNDVMIYDASADYHPNDYYINNNVVENRIVVGNNGYVAEAKDHKITRTYYKHRYNYYSVDGFDNRVVVVGHKSMCTNIDISKGKDWEEIYKENGDGFDETFYRIRFYDSQTFFVSGANGLIWKVNL
jgi:hypothetical protein